MESIHKRARTLQQTPGSINLHASRIIQDTPGLLNDGYLQGRSGILDYLQARGGRTKELEDELAASKRHQEQMLQELERKQAEIAQLRQDVVCAKSATISRAQLEGCSELAELDRLLGEELTKSLTLEGQLHAVQQQLHDTQEQASEAAAAARRAELEHQKAASSLADTAQRQIKDVQAECEELVRKAQLEARIERQNREAEREVHRVVKGQLDQVRLELAARTSQLHAPPAEASGATLLVSRVKRLEEELRAKERELKAAMVMTAQQQDDPAAALSAEHKVAAELDELRARLRAWEHGPLQQVVEEQELSNPSLAAALLSTLLARSSELGDALAAKDAELLRVGAELRAAEQQLQLMIQQLRERSGELQAAQVAEKAAGRQLAAVARERDALRQALAVPASLSGSETVSDRLEQGQQAAVAQQLQALVDDLQARTESAQREAAQAAGGEAVQRQAAAAATSRAEAAEARSAQLEKEADSLALQVAALQDKLGRGEVNRSSVRVLHFKMNPEAQLHREQADGVAAELRAENQVLSTRLAELAKEVEESRRNARSGEGGIAAGGAVSQAEGSVHAVAVRDAQVAVLRHRLGEVEKSMVRLKEVTKERVMAFREACYCLFGYRVDMSSEATAAKDAASAPTTFSLKPQHTDDPSLMLVFKYTKARGMELVPNNFSARLEREVGTFIRKFNCIPAFTANLTMENFQKQTQC